MITAWLPLSRKNSPSRSPKTARGTARRGVGSGGGDDDRIFQRAALFEHLHELRDGRALLADGDVDAVKLGLLVVAVVQGFLIQIVSSAIAVLPSGGRR